jgi:lipid A 3-O-deacylase
MIKIKTLFIILFVLFSAGSFAQSVDSSMQLKGERYFRFNYDNDFFSATDRYYTQGIRVELILPVFKRSPLSATLIPLKKSSKNYYGLALQQDGFTPISIRHDSIQYGERPYASVFFLSSFLVSINKESQKRLTSQLDLGVIGPNGYGEQEQKGIHHATNNFQPLGWEYQIANDVILNYSLNYEKGFLIRKNFELIGLIEGRLGTLYDDLSIGSTMRIGLMHNYFENLGLTNGNITNRKFQCYLFIREKAKAVGYNATMQGGVFNKKSVYTIPAKDVNRVVGIAYVGISIAYKRISIEYTKAYISPEFYQGLAHSWGHCNISFCF